MAVGSLYILVASYFVNDDKIVPILGGARDLLTTFSFNNQQQLALGFTQMIIYLSLQFSLFMLSSLSGLCQKLLTPRVMIVCDWTRWAGAPHHISPIASGGVSSD